jgi:hypothetical protein
MLAIGVVESIAARVPAPPLDLAALPRDGGALLALRVADIWNCPGAKVLREAGAAGFLEQILPDLGPGGALPAQIDRGVLCFDEGERIAGAVTLRDSGLLTRMVERDFPGEAERRLNGQRYFRDDAKWLGVVLLDRRSALYGPPDWLEVRAAHPDAPRTGPLADAIEAIPLHDLVFAARFDRPNAMTDLLVERLGEQEATRPLQKLRGLLLCVDMRKDFVVDCRFDFPDTEAAKRAMPTLERLRSLLRAGLTEFGSWGDEQKEEKEEEKSVALRKAVGAFCRKVAAAMKTAPLSRSGAAVTLSLRCSCEDSATGALLVLFKPAVIYEKGKLLRLESNQRRLAPRR